MDFLSLDVESTGVDSTVNTVIQIAAEYHRDGKCIAKFNEHILPGPNHEVNLGALRVNKFNFSKLKGIENSGETVAKKFADFVLSLPVRGQITILGQNIKMDIDFVKQLLKDNKITGWDSLFSYRVLDTGSIASFLKDFGVLPVDKTSLGDLAKYYNIDVSKDALHDAAIDANVTAQVYYKMGASIQPKDSLTRAVFTK